MLHGVFPVVDLRALASQLGCELDTAFERLRALYGELDARNAANTATLGLPCARGCSACCKDSVFLTPLEFFYVWDTVQTTLSDEARSAIVSRGLALYAEHRALIDALDGPPSDAHTGVAAQLRYDCPLLDPDGACLAYPARELYARMFGQSFNEAGGAYGCGLVGQHLAGRVVTLLRVRVAAQLLSELPLTFKRQVYPWYINLLYGA
jgi:hypothetical protein